MQSFEQEGDEYHLRIIGGNRKEIRIFWKQSDEYYIEQKKNRLDETG